VTKHEIVLERLEVVHQLEFVEEHLEQPLAGGLIRCIDGALQPPYVAVFESLNTKIGLGVQNAGRIL
jgi:hypothetical protein